MTDNLSSESWLKEVALCLDSYGEELRAYSPSISTLVSIYTHHIHSQSVLVAPCRAAQASGFIPSCSNGETRADSTFRTSLGCLTLSGIGSGSPTAQSHLEYIHQKSGCFVGTSCRYSCNFDFLRLFSVTSFSCRQNWNEIPQSND